MPLVQFQGVHGPVFVHSSAILTISVTTAPQPTLGKPRVITAVELEGGRIVEVLDEVTHAAEKWEQAISFEEELDDDSDDEASNDLEAVLTPFVEASEVLAAILFTEDGLLHPTLCTVLTDADRDQAEAWLGRLSDMMDDDDDGFTERDADDEV